MLRPSSCTALCSFTRRCASMAASRSAAVNSYSEAEPAACQHFMAEAKYSVTEMVASRLASLPSALPPTPSATSMMVATRSPRSVMAEVSARLVPCTTTCGCTVQSRN